MTPDKELERAAEEHAGWKNIPTNCLTASVKYTLTREKESFKAGAHFERKRIFKILEREPETIEFIEQSLKETKESEG